MAKKNQLYKGMLQNIILKLLSQEVKMYGYQITQRVKELTDGDLEITEGALYPLLHKMEEDNLISVDIVEVNGRRRKYYLLTERGIGYQQQEQEVMRMYLKNLKTLFNF